MQSADTQRAYAQAATGYDALRHKLDINTKRMAGAALAAAFAPVIAKSVDDQEDTFLGDFIGGGLLVGGGVGGAYYGNQGVRVDDKDAFIQSEMSKLKREGKELAQKIGPEAARDYIVQRKNQILQDIEPIAPRQANAFNARARQYPLGDEVADMDLLRKSPRTIRGSTRGAMLGLLAAALPSYLMMRGGEIDA